LLRGACGQESIYEPCSNGWGTQIWSQR
jgi:hypothetical protein